MDLFSDYSVADGTALLFSEPQNDAFVAKYVLQNREATVGHTLCNK